MGKSLGRTKYKLQSSCLCVHARISKKKKKKKRVLKVLNGKSIKSDLNHFQLKKKKKKKVY